MSACRVSYMLRRNPNFACRGKLITFMFERRSILDATNMGREALARRCSSWHHFCVNFILSQLSIAVIDARRRSFFETSTVFRLMHSLQNEGVGGMRGLESHGVSTLLKIVGSYARGINTEIAVVQLSVTYTSMALPSSLLP